MYTEFKAIGWWPNIKSKHVVTFIQQCVLLFVVVCDCSALPVFLCCNVTSCLVSRLLAFCHVCVCVEALHLVSTAADHVNETMKTTDKFKQLLEVQERISGVVDLVSPTRELQKEGKIVKISAHSGDHQERYLFLVSISTCISHRHFDRLKHKYRAGFFWLVSVPVFLIDISIG